MSYLILGNLLLLSQTSEKISSDLYRQLDVCSWCDVIKTDVSF